MNRVARGDQWALRALYDRYASRLTALALRSLGNRGEADEIVQETFVEAWKRAREFDPSRGSVGAWLTTIARTRAIDRLRSLSASKRAATASAAEPLPSPVNPGEEAAQRQAAARVRAALATLPAEQREALELAYFEGLSHREIAERTGQPLGTVKTRVRLGMEKLLACLGDLGGGEA
ncbi:MAG TPA: sigma-70 family RNA polymerase sigma factor [Myxococcales bacterium]|nr:sigma-70 family RNA polymerase sigma factor [Myxococcales bacterium]